jgi:hypothetical protein
MIPVILVLKYHQKFIDSQINVARPQQLIMFLRNITIGQNYWVAGFCPASGILNTGKQHFGNLICFCAQVRGRDNYSVGSLGNS